MEEGGRRRSSAVLNAVYPDAVPLHTFLKAALPGALDGHLFSRTDPKAYAKGLLQSTYVVLNKNAPPLASGTSLTQYSSQSEVVDRALEQLFRNAPAIAEPYNVLCFGFRKRRPWACAHASGNSEHMLRAADCITPNSSVALLKGPMWSLLLARVGDALMLYLLTHTSIFHPLPNACFLQLTGPPIYSSIPRRSTKTLPPSQLPALIRRTQSAPGQPSHSTPLPNDSCLRPGNDSLNTLLSELDSQTILPLSQPQVEDSALWSSQSQGETGMSSPITQEASDTDNRDYDSHSEGFASDLEDWVSDSDPGDMTQADKHTLDVQSKFPSVDEGVTQKLCTQPFQNQSSAVRKHRLLTLKLCKGRRAAARAQGAAALHKPIKPLAPRVGSRKRRRAHIQTAAQHLEELPQPEIQPPEEHPQSQLSSNPHVASSPHLGATQAAISHADDPPRRRARASSWQRRKAARLRRLQAQTSAQGAVSTASERLQAPQSDVPAIPAKRPAISIDTDAHSIRKQMRSLSSVQESRDLGRSATISSINTQRPSKGSGTGPSVACSTSPSHRFPATLQQRAWAVHGSHQDHGTVASMDIPRASIFYNAEMRRRPGLPPSHVLLSMGKGKRAAHRLFHHVFRGPVEAVGRPASSAESKGHAGRAESPLFAGRRTSRSPPPSPTAAEAARKLRLPARVPRQWHHLIQLLEETLKRAQALRVGPILVKFCPIPQHVRSATMDPKQATQSAPAVDTAELTGTSGINSQNFTSTPTGEPAEVSEHVRYFSQEDTSSQPVTIVEAAQSDQSTLSKHTAEPAGEARELAPSRKLPQNLIGCYSTHQQVATFVWVVLKRLMPPALLGQVGKVQGSFGLRSQIVSMIRLKRYEAFPLMRAMHHLPVASFPALHPRPPSAALCDKSTGKRCQPVPENACSQQASRLSHSAFMAAQSMLRRWVYFVMTAVVIPLLRSHFYITESEVQRQRVFYYRKPVWAAIQARAQRKLVGVQFQRIRALRVRQVLQKRMLGFSDIRLLPKRNDITRPIANLSKRAVLLGGRRVGANGAVGVWEKPLSFTPVNRAMAAPCQALRYEIAQQPWLLGSSSMFSYQDVYRSFHPFVQAVRKAKEALVERGLGQGTPPYYIVTMDVAAAFDSIPIEALWQVVEPVLQHPQYLVVKYAEVGVSHANVGGVRVRYRHTALPPGQWSSFQRFATSHAAQRGGLVFVDQAFQSRHERTTLHALLAEHVRGNMIRVGRAMFLQRQGIPQGSTLSTLLCSVFYNNMETEHLRPLGLTQDSSCPPSTCIPTGHEIHGRVSGETPHVNGGIRSNSLDANADASVTWEDNVMVEHEKLKPLLLRLTDDYLFITTNRKVAQMFVRRMLEGFPSHGCTFNAAKTALNFDMDHNGSRLHHNMYTSADGSVFIRWIGLMINCKNLEVMADYTRYQGENIAATVNFTKSKGVGGRLVLKLCHYMRPKCYTILFDGSINSPLTTRLNVYQAFLLCAMKFHALVKCLDSGPCRNAAFFQKAIHCAVRYMDTLVHQRLKLMWYAHDTRSINMGTRGGSCGSISHTQIQWLGLHAFAVVLKRKQSRYCEVLRLLGRDLAAPAFYAMPLQLADVVHEPRSSVFRKIIY